ncbi:MAG: antibiotic biosynthesis monooxygenase [Alphaproteobacteria bacterium]|nr:antibiotic biosynthesis monooxygenase [Alphaproteobacteria bacterium]MDE2041717.1 antibiotic biosynthesis monooxygenase [Alphaproteobacteria bacterium]MDE2340118.1 antibiotic biosynthesis monooxygenase [Alphaproteobacteria bacterium]
MIFVAGIMNMNPSDIPSFVADYDAMRNDVLAEPGCHHYSLLVEDAPTGLVNVMEMWDDVDALKVHLGTPHIAKFFAAHAPHMQASTVQVYHISGAEPLPGM